MQYNAAVQCGADASTHLEPRVMVAWMFAAQSCAAHMFTQLLQTLSQGSDGRKMLKSLEAALSALGATDVACDMGMWTITAGRAAL